MEQEADTIYRWQASQYLKVYDQEKNFYVKERVKFENGGELFPDEKITVIKVWITNGSRECQMHMHGRQAFREWEWYKVISVEDYRKFKNYKGDKRRLNLFLKVFGDEICVKKDKATKHIDIRVTPDFFSVLAKGAEQCKRSLSDYCRDILKDKTPRVALSDDEKIMMSAIMDERIDILDFRNALKGVMMKMSPEQRTHFLILDEKASWYVEHIKRVLIYLDNIIQRNKNN